MVRRHFAQDHPEDGFLGPLLTMMVGHDASAVRAHAAGPAQD